MPKHVNKKVLGSGKLYLALEDANGNLTGERYLGDTPGFSVGVETTKVEDYTSDEAIAEKDVLAVTQVVRSGKVTAKDISIDNLALFAVGEVKVVNQAATAVVDEAHNGVAGGRWYQLGRDTANPTGVRNVSAFTLKKGGVALVENTDYEVDLVNARFYVVPGKAADGQDVAASYTPAANSRSRVETGGVKAVYGALHFIADNTLGPNRDLYGPRVQLQPSGELAMKSRDTIQQMEFDVEFLKSDRGAAVYIDDQPVAA